MNYPIIMKSLIDGSIVKFTSLQTGTYLKSNIGTDIWGEEYATGTTHNDFIPCTNKENWSELIEKQINTSTRGNGDSTNYYKLPIDAKELGDLIKHKKMEHGIGEAFCALYRLNDNGEYKRNLVKAKYYIEKELEWLEKQANQ